MMYLPPQAAANTHFFISHHLREHDMLTKSSKLILGVFMFAGLYFIYKWFSKRIDTIQKQHS